MRTSEPGGALIDAQGSSEEGVERVLVAHLPDFRLEREGFLAEELAVLVAEQKNATRIVALTSYARSRDLVEGMTASQARALEPELLLHPWDEDAERIDRMELVDRFRSLSSRVSPLGESDVGLEVGRSAHLFGGEEGLLQAAEDLAARFGHEARCVIADDLLAASALARFGTGSQVVPSGQSAERLAYLPIEALSPSPSMGEALRVIGVERVADLAALEPSAVAGRYGEEGVRLLRVARGQVASARLPNAPEVLTVARSVQLGGPTTLLAPIHFLLPGLLTEITDELRTRDQLVARLLMRLVLDRGPARLVRMRVGRPTRDVAVLERVVRQRLEAVKLEAPAVELMLEVEEAVVDTGQQPGLTERAEAAEPLPDLLARLADALGEESLITPVLADSWRPEHAWRPHSALLPAPRESRARPKKVDPVEVLERYEQQLFAPRPTLLLEQPLGIDVKLDGSDEPVAVRLQTGWQRVTRCSGPEVLMGEWWLDDRGFDRACWVVQVQGGTGWIYEDRLKGRWYWAGWFD